MSYQLMLFPGFKEKALTFSYDDGKRSDIRLTEIFNKHGLKGTFNLCSGLLGGERSVKTEELASVYLDAGHEIAVHGKRHLSLTSVPEVMAVDDIFSDRKALEAFTGRMIRGMAYANGSFNDRVVEILASLGISYARTTKSTGTFAVSNDFLRLAPTCHHDNPKLFELADEFLKDYDETKYYWSNSPKLFYVWGHSYEFDTKNNWDRIEKFAEMLGGNERIWYATNGEIVDYIRAYDSLIFSSSGSSVFNPSCTDVYMRTLSKAGVLIPSGKTVNI